MSHRPPIDPSGSILGFTLYLGFLAAVLASTGSFVYATFQPARLPNPGLAAYHPPAALALYPPPRVYSTPAPVVLADAQTGEARTHGAQASPAAAASNRQAQNEPTPASRTPKKTKSRARDPADPSSATYAQWPSRDARQSYAQWPPRDSRQGYAQWSPSDSHQWSPGDSQWRGREARNPSPAQSRPRDPRNPGQMTFAQSGFSW